MKKLLGVIAALFLAGNLFAINVDTYGSLDYTYGFNYLFAKDYQDKPYNISGHGFNFNISSYFLGDLGLYFNSSTTFGAKDFPDEKSTMFDMGLGLTYRYSIHSTLEVYGSAGAMIASFGLGPEDNKWTYTGYGACIDLGARVLATNILFFDAGVYTSYTFSDMTIQHNQKDQGKTSWHFLNVKPHIGIGLIYRESF